ncbi:MULTISPECIES: hypothetical protein [unclassified Rathayibacter]|uniref:hypothetical protein n=1 Tax=unclassified Rathayibacter TaxID=2609250 RepID=UPI000CE8541C|nr:MULTISPECIES: hypothetical protein [unclassified Rathayibacter]PPG07300.1 hypothetical protein C5C26_09830 [Rathayibacter sp. AY2B1]PPG73903.1 hypothetical protein C5C59_00035 [Rathayibacter sp. AY1F4]
MGAAEERTQEFIGAWDEPQAGARGLRWDAAYGPGLRVTRVWAPEGIRVDRPPASDRAAESDGVHVSLIVEGGGDMILEEGSLEAVPNSVLVLEARTAARIDYRRPTLSYTWSFDAAVLEHRWVRERINEVVPVRESVWTPARALANSLIEGDPAVLGAAGVRRASELLLEGIVEHSAPRVRTRGADQVYAEAIPVIEARHRDPAFSAAVLARELLVSPRVLAEAFAFLGRTPAEEIETRRAGTLRRRIGLRRRRPADFARLAEECGYGTREQAALTLGRSAS